MRATTRCSALLCRDDGSRRAGGAAAVSRSPGRRRRHRQASGGRHAPPPATQQPGPRRRMPSEPTEGSLGVPIYPAAAVHHVLRRRARTALLPLWHHRRLRRDRAVLQDTLKQRGELVFEEPPVHQFDIGRFREETMAFPPSVTVKDYTWGGIGGISESEARRPAGSGSRPSSRSCRTPRCREVVAR